MKKLLLIFAIVLMIFQTAEAQSVERLIQVLHEHNQGSKVRVTTSYPFYRAVGIVTGLSADTLKVKQSSGYVVAVPLASVVRLEISHKKREILKGTVYGFVFGAIIGGAAGAVFAANLGKDECEWNHCVRLYAFVGAGVHAALGTVAGFTAGALIKVEHWEIVK